MFCTFSEKCSINIYWTFQHSTACFLKGQSPMYRELGLVLLNPPPASAGPESSVSSSLSGLRFRTFQLRDFQAQVGHFNA